MTQDTLPQIQDRSAVTFPGYNADWRTVWVLLICAAVVVASALQIALNLDQQGLLILVLTVMVCALASWYDAGTGRVPNALTYTAIVVGLVINLIAGGFELADIRIVTRWTGSPGMLEALGGFGFCAVLGLLCLFVAGLGGGDMKLMAALGALLGFEEVLSVLLNGFAVAGVFALVNLIWAGRLTATLRYLAYAVLTRYYARQHLPEPPYPHQHVPLAVPLLVGLVTAQFIPLVALLK